MSSNIESFYHPVLQSKTHQPLLLCTFNLEKLLICVCSVIAIGKLVWEDPIGDLWRRMWKLIFSLLRCGRGEPRPSPRTYLKHGPAKWGENIGAKWGENEAEVLEIHFKKLGPIGAVQVMRLSANDCQGWENSNVIAPSSYQLLLFLLSLLGADVYLSVNYRLILKYPTDARIQAG